jgi:hypothetical protein
MAFRSPAQRRVSSRVSKCAAARHPEGERVPVRKQVKDWYRKATPLLQRCIVGRR